VAPNMLVDFKFNSTMLGGMVVQYGSHIYDWSFRQRILDARDKFPEVLRSV
jgi:F0F1-type ATP synthase delta subunit